MTFSDIEGFYRRHVAGRPVSIIVVGDPRIVKRKRLGAYGPVVVTSVRDVLDR